jgi:tetratricopeptide (TPR) repeat protein
MRPTWSGLPVILAAGLAAAQPAAMEPDDLPVPPADDSSDAVDVPDPPSLAVPAADDGVHDVRALRFDRSLLGSQLKVGGYITWIYDCATAIGKPGVPRARVQRQIDNDPSLCERPKFHLGPARKAPEMDTIWVVDVPRHPFKIEKERLPRDELAARPPVPRLAAGAYVVVTGTWTLRSPHAEFNSDGLLVYEALDHVAPPAAAPRMVPPPAAPALAVTVVTRPPLRPVVPIATRTASRDAAGRCIAAYAQKQLADARAACQQAVATWDHNHNAWYALIGVAASSRDWAAARDAAAHAVAARPDVAMYQLYLGRMTYEALIAKARAELAAAQGKQPDQVVPDLTAVDFTDALRPLLAAVKLEPRLWRAHYFIGRIYRDNGHWNEAAGELTAAVRLGPRDSEPYVALCELYRRWDVHDLALTIATLGTQHVLRSADVWFELGMVHDELRHDADAIAAFTRALAIDPEYAVAKFQRGQAYFRTKARAKARADLEDFVAHPPARSDFEVAQANKMLLELH